MEVHLQEQMEEAKHMVDMINSSSSLDMEVNSRDTDNNKEETHTREVELKEGTNSHKEVMVVDMAEAMEVVTSSNRDTEEVIKADMETPTSSSKCSIIHMVEVHKATLFHLQDKKNNQNMAIILHHRYTDLQNRKIYQRMSRPVKYLSVVLVEHQKKIYTIILRVLVKSKTITFKEISKLE